MVAVAHHQRVELTVALHGDDRKRRVLLDHGQCIVLATAVVVRRVRRTHGEAHLGGCQVEQGHLHDVGQSVDHVVVELGEEGVGQQRQHALGVDHPARSRVAVVAADDQRIVQVAAQAHLQLVDHGLPQVLEDTHGVRTDEDHFVVVAPRQRHGLEGERTVRARRSGIGVRERSEGRVGSQGAVPAGADPQRSRHLHRGHAGPELARIGNLLGRIVVIADRRVVVVTVAVAGRDGQGQRDHHQPGPLVPHGVSSGRSITLVAVSRKRNGEVTPSGV